MAQEIVPGTTTDQLVALIAKVVDERLAEFSRSGFLNHASISDGGLRVNNGGNIELRGNGRLDALHPNEQSGAVIGRINAESNGSYAGLGVLVQQDDGTDIFSARDDVATGGSVVAIRDRAGNAVAYTLAAKDGLGGPTIPIVFAPWAFAGWQGTTSGTFTPVLAAFARRWNPELRVALATVADAGTTGEARLLVNGVQAGPTIAVGTASTTTTIIVDSPAGIGAQAELRIECRRTAGTGQVRANSYAAEGWS